MLHKPKRRPSFHGFSQFLGNLYAKDLLLYEKITIRPQYNLLHQIFSTELQIKQYSIRTIIALNILSKEFIMIY